MDKNQAQLIYKSAPNSKLETREIFFRDYIENGFKTEIPGLLENELVYFQYLYAINTRKQSAKYPDEEDSSTWYSVLHDRRFMLNKLGLDLNTDARLPR